MFRKKKPPPNDALAILKSFVDPTPILEPELERAKRELLAAAEQDMTVWERARFRYQLWRLSRQVKDTRQWMARW